MNVRQVVPFSFTVAALFAGLFSILKSAAGEYVVAAQFIMLSMILDGMDGTLARLLKGTTRFGAELDTFVDIISFGVAPAVLAYQAALQHFGIWGILLVSGIVLSGAMRLARFRVVDPYRGQHGFLGLPITICGGWLAMMVFVTECGVLDDEIFRLSQGPFAAFVWIVTGAMAVLQVSHLHYSKPTKELVFFVPCIFLVGFLFFGHQVAVSASLAMSAYGIFYAFVTPFIPRQELVIEDDEDEEPARLRHS